MKWMANKKVNRCRYDNLQHYNYELKFIQKNVCIWKVNVATTDTQKQANGKKEKRAAEENSNLICS